MRAVKSDWMAAGAFALCCAVATPAFSAGSAPEGAVIDSRCLADDKAAEGWYVSDNRRGDSASYLILHKQQQGDHFYLCRLQGERRDFATELGIEANPATSRIEAARCTPVETGVPGTGYFSVIDNRTAQIVRIYRFDALEEDVETMSPDSVVCSALPAGAPAAD